MRRRHCSDKTTDGVLAVGVLSDRSSIPSSALIFSFPFFFFFSVMLRSDRPTWDTLCVFFQPFDDLGVGVLASPDTCDKPFSCSTSSFLAVFILSRPLLHQLVRLSSSSSFPKLERKSTKIKPSCRARPRQKKLVSSSSKCSSRHH
ncbi:hypothetical protein BKA81DRAFT_394983 [Phyllosticta paracitricarpa]